MASVSVEVPSVGESVKEGVLASWIVVDGASVREGDDLFELETDKATMVVPSPGSGTLRIRVAAGAEVKIGQAVAEIEAGVATAAAAAASTPAKAAAAPTPPLSPAVRRVVEESRLDPAAIGGTGKGGRITKADALAAAAAATRPGAASPAQSSAGQRPASPAAEGSRRREHMSSLRRSIARRLVEAKTLTAHLTTFGELDMSRILELRRAHQEAFQARHGVKLGLMSFFIKAASQALGEFPTVNAMIDGDDVVYNDARDIGVAVSTDSGLVVPVIRGADAKSLAALERELGELAARAKERRILPDELAGGTFTITNGGVFGSLLSTPIINYPQSAILGMHAIEQRPVVVEGAVVARPMMYLALSYDHRLIDGREAITFLLRVKALCEAPERLLLEV